jgi:hypothetical protein
MKIKSIQDLPVFELHTVKRLRITSINSQPKVEKSVKLRLTNKTRKVS